MSCSAIKFVFLKQYLKLIRGIRTTKTSWIPNIFLTKYQLSVYLCLLSAEKINLSLVNINKKSLSYNWFWGMEKKVNKIWLKNICWSTKFWWFGCHEWVISFIYFNSTIYVKKFSNEVSAKHQPYSVTHVSNSSMHRQEL